jgi:L-aminopeptidase/D-esterase-like protein
MENHTLTALPGIRVGHAQTETGLSGCTVILLEDGCGAGVDIRGGAPGTYGTEGLNPLNLVDRVHAVFLTGGSAFGLAVGDGVRRYLKDRGVGFQTEYGVVPIVCGAVIFDLGINRHGSPPDAALGIRACESASTRPVEEGCVGAGCGATVGKLLGLDHAMKGGLGSHLLRTPSGLCVAALAVVNPFGDVVDRASGRILAGCRTAPDKEEILDSQQALLERKRLRGFSAGENTVLGVIATNAAMGKVGLTKVAQMAHDGLARSIVPCHTQYDGDTVFALSCGDLQDVEVSIVGSLAAQCLEAAVIRAVRAARSRGGLPAACDLTPAAPGRIGGGD